MDTGIYNGYGNPYFEQGGRATHSPFFALSIKIEDEVLKALIPIFDLLNLDELVTVTTYISTFGCAMFTDYLSDREPASDVQEDVVRLKDVAHNCYLLAKQAANDVAKEHLDSLSYYEAMALTAYINANFMGMFATYTLMRQMRRSASERGRNTISFQEHLDRQRADLGLPAAHNDDIPDEKYLVQDMLDAVILDTVESKESDDDC
jgi:hypothetical protein